MCISDHTNFLFVLPDLMELLAGLMGIMAAIFSRNHPDQVFIKKPSERFKCISIGYNLPYIHDRLVSGLSD